MKYVFRNIICLLLCLRVALPLTLVQPVRAEEADSEEVVTIISARVAADISSSEVITASEGIPGISGLFDGNIYSGRSSADNASMTIEYESGLGSLYFIFEKAYGPYTVTDNGSGESITCGEYGFMHEFIDLEASFGTAPSSVTVSFPNSVCINELSVYTPGEVPDTVQKWSAPVEDGTDLILFSTHGDDEQLFFAGLLPYYAGELGYQVQVVYLTDHTNQVGTRRMREMLAGLWAVGVTTYPVFGSFADFKTEDKDAAYQTFKALGSSREELLGFVVEQIRRFNPLVVVGHDFEGEYRHGQHMVYAELLAEALEISNDESYYPELAEQYGLWDVPKAYFHLYEENEIVMDWDQPLEKFGGLTAFQVTQQLGFPCHKSQQNTWFYRWIYGDYGEVTQASQLEKYSPCHYGLYRSTVGDDVEKNDFFENLNTYAEQARIAEEERLAEEARIAEEERLAEEARLAEEQRLAEEEAARLASEEAALQESEAETETETVKQSSENKTGISQQQIIIIGLACIAVLLAAVLVLLIILLARGKKKK